MPSLDPNRKKVDLTTLTADEQRIFRLYGKLPSQANILNQKLSERKYFDSGDYAMSQAGKTSSTDVGSQHPDPQSIPHHLSKSSTLSSASSNSSLSSSPTGAN